jgi:hypothetical protein
MNKLSLDLRMVEEQQQQLGAIKNLAVVLLIETFKLRDDDDNVPQNFRVLSSSFRRNYKI